LEYVNKTLLKDTTYYFSTIPDINGLTISGDGSDDDALVEDPAGHNAPSNAPAQPGSGSDSGIGTALAVLAVGTAVVGGVVIARNWDKLPVHKAEGTLTDASGAAVAGATVTLEKGGEVVKTVTTDASGSFKAYVPQGDYTLTATAGDASVTLTGYTPGQSSAALVLGAGDVPAQPADAAPEQSPAEPAA
jgi:hypothetical protein